MSGGSHNYLYKKLRSEGELGGVYSYVCMEESLRSNGHTEAADRVQEITVLLERAQVLHLELEDVMHMQEWHDSRDVGREEVVEAVDRWKANRRG